VAQLRHTALARADLLDIWGTIATDSPASADRLYDRLEERVQILTQWPMIGVACPAIAPDARILIERPYLILYRVIRDGVQIVRVLHGARDIDSALFMDGVE
jgi:toxin ParE1/3/4